MTTEGKPIRITVGAALDRSTLNVFQQIADRAKAAASAVDRDQQRSMAAQAAAARTAVREAERAARQKQAAAERAARDEERLAARTAAARVREEKRAAREIERELEKTAKARERADKQAAAAAMKVLREQAREAKRIGEIQARDRKRAEYGREQAALAVRRDAMSAVGRVGGLAMRGLRFAAGVGRSMAQGYGLDTDLGSIIGKNAELEQQAVQLSNQAYMPGASGAAGVRQDPRELMGTAFRIGGATGIGANEVMGGLEKFTSLTGDLETGQQVMGRLAMLSKATGTNLEDMAAAAGNASNQLGDIPNKAVVIDQLMRQIAGQGKLGAVEIKDLASQMAKVAAAAGQIEGDPAKTIQTMGIIAQSSRQHGGSATATQAATAVGALVNTWKTPARRAAFAQAGVKLESSPGVLRNPEEIIIESLQKRGMNTGGWKELYANVQGERAVSGFRSTYVQAYQKTQGTEAQKMAAATAAVRDEFDKLRKAAIEEDELRESFTRSLGTGKSQAEQWNNQIQQTTLELQSQLLPALKATGPALVYFAGSLGKILKPFMPDADVPREAGDAMKTVLKARGAQERALESGRVTETQMNQSEALVKVQRKNIENLRADAKTRRGEAGGLGSYVHGAMQYGHDFLSGELSGGQYALSVLGPLGALVHAQGIMSRADAYTTKQQQSADLEDDQAAADERELNKLVDVNQQIKDRLDQGLMVTIKNAPTPGAKPGDVSGMPEEPE